MFDSVAVNYPEVNGCDIKFDKDKLAEKKPGERCSVEEEIKSIHNVTVCTTAIQVTVPGLTLLYVQAPCEALGSCTPVKERYLPQHRDFFKNGSNRDTVIIGKFWSVSLKDLSKQVTGSGQS